MTNLYNHSCKVVALSPGIILASEMQSQNPPIGPIRIQHKCHIACAACKQGHVRVMVLTLYTLTL